MSLTQFAMVEELAFLVRNNLPCKNLVLSMEDTLIHFLQDHHSSNAALELQPMNPYNRLLLHRLADIFGFSHQSVGEGDGRHLVLERCSETSIPSILVSDLLWQYGDEHQSTGASDIVSRVEASQGIHVRNLKAHTPAPNNSIDLQALLLANHKLAEREAAYMAARQRIFASGEGGPDVPLKQKPPRNPVVARRMIAHALGKKIESPDEDDINIQLRTGPAPNAELDNFKDSQTLSTRRFMRGELEVVEYDGSALSSTGSEVTTKQVDILKSKIHNFRISEVQKANIKKEQTGAARRMFANALGYPSGRENSILKFNERKLNKKEKAVNSK